MKTRLCAVALLFLILTGLVACGQATPAAPTSAPAIPTAAPTAAPATKAPTVAPTQASDPASTLEVTNGTITKTLSLTELQKLTVTEG